MLLVEARGAIERDAPIDLSEYADVIGQLRGKNYSFGRIADWLAERLGRAINKGGVFRVYQTWEIEQKYAAEEIDFSPSEPPDDEEETDRLILKIAEEVRSAAVDSVANQSLPEFFADEGILRAAAIIEQERADERAADDADKATESPKTENDGSNKPN